MYFRSKRLVSVVIVELGVPLFKCLHASTSTFQSLATSASHVDVFLVGCVHRDKGSGENGKEERMHAWRSILVTRTKFCQAVGAHERRWTIVLSVKT